MKIKVIDHGVPEDRLPFRAHANDVGADVFASRDVIIETGGTFAMPLGFGLELPIGLSGFIFTRSSMAKKGVDVYLPPIDPGYMGEIHAIIHNGGYDAYHVKAGDRIGQLVIMPALTPDFVFDLGEERGAGAFGSTGK